MVLTASSKRKAQPLRVYKKRLLWPEFDMTGAGFLVFALAAMALGGCQFEDTSTAPMANEVVSTATTRPNILLIVADDLGYSDIGRFGGEIRTPNIDELARSGQTFSQFYAAATCSPSRAMLLTGVDNHLAGLGNMGEETADNQRGKPGYEGFINHQVVTLPTRLGGAGYNTYMVGKWHLGAKPGTRPHERGFDQSFALLQGGSSHFADMKRVISMYPETVYLENGVKVDSLPEEFYSSKDFADKMIGYLQADQPDAKPFFAFLSFTAPHWPLQVPDDYRDLYQGVYDSGYDIVAKRRLLRMKNLGLVPEEISEVERVPLAEPWDTLSETEKARSVASMEVYAAMVERMDFHIGRVLEQLRKDGRYDNTLVIILSDNGAEGNDRMRLHDNATWVPANFDLSLNNIGRVDSYAMLKAGWGQVSSMPFRFFKGYSTEGGLRVPLIVSGPGIEPIADYRRSVTTILDLARTVVDFAGAADSGETQNDGTVHPMTGRSMRGLLAGSDESLYDHTEALGWEMFGHRAIRKGDWKILWADGRNGTEGWQLFNIAQDPRETEDLGRLHPEKLTDLKREWDQYVERNNLILPDGLDSVF